MKAKLIEYDGCFGIELVAEDAKEMATMVRFGVNRTTDVRFAGTNVYQDGTTSTTVVFGKSKRWGSDVVRRK